MRSTLQSPTLRPSLALLLAVVLVTVALGLLRSGWLERVDLLIYDLMLIQQRQAAPAEVVIIAIDERSLQQLGRWPWSRQVHARLIDRLTEAGARAIALDILLSEPERHDAGADGALAEAMKRNGKVLLAVAPEQIAGARHLGETLPLPILADSAAGLGHVDFEIDRDGLCRRIYLYAGLDAPHWPALALATHKVGAGPSNRLRKVDQVQEKTGRWVRQQPVLMPYIGREGRIRQLSYVDVLNGRIDPEQLRERYVLVGATAAGLGDSLATPMAQAHSRMPGVELNANALAGLLRGHVVTELRPWSSNLMTMVLVAVPLLLLIGLGNRRVLLLLGGAAVLTLLVAGTLLYGPGLWFAPSAVLVTLAIAYPLMSWLRLQSTVEEVTSRARDDWQATTIDSLTGLPNRERLRKELQTGLPRVLSEGKMLGLLVLNLKRFKTVYDRFGIAAGDRLLGEAADRLHQVVRQDDLVVRLDSNEFGIMMSGLDNQHPLQELAGRIERTLRKPFETEPDPVILSAHLGATLFPADGKDADTLLQNAIAAMHHARERDIQELVFYSEELRARVVNRSELELALQGALERGELEIHYQPQISAGSGLVVGVEALLRWRSPRHGAVVPTRFIPIAEHTGLIVRLGAWVLDQACRQAQQWQQKGLPDLRMAVNLSAVQFARPGLVETVRQTLQRTGISADRLELELTEGILIEDVHTTLDTLSALKQMGVRISVDDFGTGYSSLSYLKRFPLDRIKIDRSFIAEIEQERESTDITLAIIAMAHRLNLEVVAEGVETELQQNFLLDNQCDELQGFLFAEPLPADQLEDVLRRARHLVPRGESSTPPAA